jgi:hypothetical protein
MAKVRLKCNMIVNRKHLNRGQVVDDSELTELLRGEQYVDYEDLGGRENQVLLLHGLQYSGHPQKHGEYGVNMSFPVTLAAGELVNLEDIPERHRDTLQEGEDYITEWTEKQRQQLRHEQTERELKYFQPAKGPNFYDA